MVTRPTRTLLAVGVALASTLAAACGPTPARPNADYQFGKHTSAPYLEPLACSYADGPAFSNQRGPASAGVTYDPRVESVDGVNERVMWFPTGWGFRFSPLDGEMGPNAYSLALLFRLEDVSGFRRLVQFKYRDSDAGLYLSSGTLRFWPRLDATGAKVVVANEWVQVVLTRNAQGVVTGYVDGVQQFRFTDTAGDAAATENALILFQDNYTGGAINEHAAGAVARFRVFDRPLSATEVANLGQTPATECT